MYTKSIILQIAENNELRDNFKNELISFMDKYIIEDAVMTLIESEIMEVTKGYFVMESEFDNIKDAINNFDPNIHVLRVLENEKFQVGKVYTFLSDCPKDHKIFDIDELSYTD